MGVMFENEGIIQSMYHHLGMLVKVLGSFYLIKQDLMLNLLTFGFLSII